jgi:hypothetical protein
MQKRWERRTQCGHAHIIIIAALGRGAPRRNGEIHICRNTGIPAKSVNYFWGNMKDTLKHLFKGDCYERHCQKTGG